MVKTLLGICVSLFLVWPTANLVAHELGIVQVDVDWVDQNQLLINARVPDGSIVDDPVLPDICIQLSSAASPLPGTQNRQWLYQCPRDEIAAEHAIILPWSVDGLFVGDSKDGYFVDSGKQDFALPLLDTAERSAAATFVDYLGFGITHILSGWDHLAFVLALCLLVSGWRLLLLVSMFTVGHSLTLALAVLGLVSLPSAPLEACIALSIAFMAREIILRRKESAGVGLVLAFGLLHGMGFAGALTEFGMDSSNVLLPLLAFNLGVEIGQVIFVIVVVGVRMALDFRLAEKTYVVPTAWAVGTLGMFWTIERVAGAMVA